MSTAATKAEKAVAYAALILVDEAPEISHEKLQILLKAAGIEDVEPIWTTLFANALNEKPIQDFITVVPGPVSGLGEGDNTPIGDRNENTQVDGGTPREKIPDSASHFGFGFDDDEESFGGLFD